MNIAIAGTGRVGTALALAIQSSIHVVSAIISRDVEAAKHLASQIGAGQAMSYDEMSFAAQPDIILLCVPDQAIEEVAMCFVADGVSHATLVHTSGATPLLDPANVPSSGVLWPVYSVKAPQTIVEHNVPMVLDASDDQARELVSSLAAELSDTISSYDYQQRQVLHMAASMSNNLVEHLLNRVFAFVIDEGLDPLLLSPLIRDALHQRLTHAGPGALTGPARRRDMKTIDTHRANLKRDQKLLAVYNCLTEDILNHYSREEE